MRGVDHLYKRLVTKLNYMTAVAQKANKPSLFWAITDVGRAMAELGASLPFQRLYGKTATGDGHPVIVLPGFMASKRSTAPLRKFIRKQGYDVQDWGLGRNYGKIEYKNALIAKIDDLYQERQERISLIGWSLGGVFARELAKERPDLIRQVITLGSPFRAVVKKNNATWLYEYVSGGQKVEDIDPTLLADIPNPAPVPTTAIYSKEDGVVPWQYCMEKEETDIHQNIQVRGSHLGLGVNPSVLHIIADRLQYAQEDWQLFEPGSLLEDLFLYPSL